MVAGLNSAFMADVGTTDERALGAFHVGALDATLTEAIKSEDLSLYFALSVFRFKCFFNTPLIHNNSFFF